MNDKSTDDPDNQALLGAIESFAKTIQKRAAEETNLIEMYLAYCIDKHGTVSYRQIAMLCGHAFRNGVKFALTRMAKDAGGKDNPISKMRGTYYISERIKSQLDELKDED